MDKRLRLIFEELNKHEKISFRKSWRRSECVSILFVYRDGEGEPFMEFAVTASKELEFTFYRSERNVPLNLAEWDEVRNRAIAFLPRAIADEEAAGYQ